jgi:hypothetical protein
MNIRLNFAVVTEIKNSLVKVLIWNFLISLVIYLLKLSLDGIRTSDLFDPSEYLMEPTSINVSEYSQTVHWYVDVGLTVIVLGVLSSPPLLN